MAHLAGEQIAVFLGKLALGYVEKDPEHAAADHALIIALAARSNPPDLLSVDDAEVDFKGTQNIARGRERRANPVEVLRMDAGRQLFERDDPIVRRHPPQAMGALVHGDVVCIDVPRPQGDPGRVGSDAKTAGVPYGGSGGLL
jgi:hypothetical protein